MFSRLGTMLARGAPIASLWTISVALCPSQRTLPIVWCTPPLMSKASSLIILTLGTVPWGCTCTIGYAKPPCSKYAGSRLIIPRRTQYNNRLYPSILEPRNHHGPLIDPAMGEPCPMEVVGDFKATDPIFKGCYGDSLLYSDDNLAQLRQQKVYLPTFQEEIPMPPALSYWQDREPATAKQSPRRVAAPDMSLESPKSKHSSNKSGPPRGTGHSSNTSTPKCPDSTSAKKPSCPQESTPDRQAKSPQDRSSRKHSHSPSPAAGSEGCK